MSSNEAGGAPVDLASLHPLFVPRSQDPGPEARRLLLLNRDVGPKVFNQVAHQIAQSRRHQILTKDFWNISRLVRQELEAEQRAINPALEGNEKHADFFKTFDPRAARGRRAKDLAAIIRNALGLPPQGADADEDQNDPPSPGGGGGGGGDAMDQDFAEPTTVDEDPQVQELRRDPTVQGANEPLTRQQGQGTALQLINRSRQEAVAAANDPSNREQEARLAAGAARLMTGGLSAAEAVDRQRANLVETLFRRNLDTLLGQFVRFSGGQMDAERQEPEERLPFSSLDEMLRLEEGPRDRPRNLPSSTFGGGRSRGRGQLPAAADNTRNTTTSESMQAEQGAAGREQQQQQRQQMRPPPEPLIEEEEEEGERRRGRGR